MPVFYRSQILIMNIYTLFVWVFIGFGGVVIESIFIFTQGVCIQGLHIELTYAFERIQP